MLEIPENIDLDNEEFRQAWRILKQTDRSLFLTGKAGTGKSTFLRYICHNIGKEHIVLAPTGVAAVNVGGMTLHSFFQIPLRPLPPDDPEYSTRRIAKSLKYSRRKRAILRNVKLIIIDEVSMVRPDIIDFIDRVLRYIMKQPKLPFGGKQLLFVGDVFQLEPVITADSAAILERYYDNFYFFNAAVFRETPVLPIELKKVYRQADSDFVNMLDRLRINAATDNDLERINNHPVAASTDNNSDFAITLTCRRETADNINQIRMSRLKTKAFTFKGEVTGNFPDPLLPTELELTLKKGAQVMLIRNDKEKRWVNGTLAHIIDINEKNITITLEDGQIYDLEPSQWENMKYYYDEKENCVKQQVLGIFRQYPVRPAWALTIHKSQGLTFNHVTIDMEGGAFSPGQTYVALSRCTSLEGINIKTPISGKDIMVSDSAVEFSRRFNDKEEMQRAFINSMADKYYAEARRNFEYGDLSAAVESFYSALCYRNDLMSKAARRLLGVRLSIINSLRNENHTLKCKLRKVADEYLERAREYFSAENWDKERLFIEKAMEVAPDYPPAILEKARIMIIDEDTSGALDIIKPFLKRKDIIGAKAHALKGSIHLLRSEPKKAAAAYKKSHRLNPKDETVKEILLSL